MLNITNTKDISCKNIKVLVHGPSGSGKTRLCATTGGKTLIISAEAGLLSLRGVDIDVFEIKNVDDLRAVYTHLLTDSVYSWICLDSISEVAECVLAAEMKLTKDPRKAYGELLTTVSELIRAFRDLPKNVYMSAKQDRVKDDVTGQVFFGPSAPGQKLGASLPFFFDEVLALHNWKDETGAIQSAFQTQRDDRYEAKDRSGALNLAEPADLSKIYAKIMNQQTTGV